MVREGDSGTAAIGDRRPGERDDVSPDGASKRGNKEDDFRPTCVSHRGKEGCERGGSSLMNVVLCVKPGRQEVAQRQKMKW